MGEMGCLSLLDLPARFERLGEVRLREVGTPPWAPPPCAMGATMKWTALRGSSEWRERSSRSERREFISDIWGKRGATYGRKGACVGE